MNTIVFKSICFLGLVLFVSLCQEGSMAEAESGDSTNLDDNLIQTVAKEHLEYVINMVREGKFEFNDEKYKSLYGPYDLNSWKGYKEPGFSMNHYATTHVQPWHYQAILMERNRTKSDHPSHTFIPFVVPRKTGIYAMAIVKDEGIYLKEWINYHLNMGIEHFLIFDNDSTDETTNVVLKPYIEAGIVEYFEWSSYNPHPAYIYMRDNFGMVNSQMTAYTYGVTQLKERNKRAATANNNNAIKWVVSMDIDEFIAFANQTETLDSYMNSHLQDDKIPSDLTCVILPWKYFSASGHVYRPQGNVIENYNRECNLVADGPPEFNFKSICMVDRISAYYSAHIGSDSVVRMGLYSADLSRKYIANENNSPRWMPHGYGPVYMAHYYAKSLQDFIEKKDKRTKNPTDPFQLGYLDFFAHHWFCWDAKESDCVYKRFSIPRGWI